MGHAVPDGAEETRDAPDLTPAGFTRMLQEAGALPQGAVTSAAITQRQRTAVSNLCFARLTYSRQATKLPESVLVKWPLETTAGPDSELTFYTELAPSLGSPPIARCLAAAPLSTALPWLVLEDLRSTHMHPPWPDPPSPLQAEGAVSILAQVHARWWEAPALGNGVGALHTETSLRAMVSRIAAGLPGFLATLGETLSRRDREVLERVFGSSLGAWLRLVDRRALTVVHGDAHSLNFLFPRSGAGLSYLVDWQLWHLDVGARDLAYLIALHWSPILRRDLERPLLHRYHRQLVARGVGGYSFDDLWLDYRRCAVRNLTFPIVLWSRGQPVQSWRHRLECALASYRDLDGDELL